MKHRYLVAACKERNGCWTRLKYLGTGEGLVEVPVPEGVTFSTVCECCSQMHYYTAADVVPIRLPGAPEAQFRSWLD